MIVRACCHTYFKTEAAKVTMQWPGFMLEYRRRTRRLDLEDHEFAHHFAGSSPSA